MPELPEVQVVVNYLKTQVLNYKIISINVLNDKFIKNTSVDSFINSLVGSKIIDIDRIGKYLIFHLNNNFSLVVHLRMEGKFFVNESLKKHDYIVFEFENNIKLAYNDSRQFGTFHLVKTNDLFKLKEIKKVASDPLDEQIDINKIVQIITNSNKAIKTVLLDQTVISGIGNIYANEILFLSHIHPLTKGKNLDETEIKNIILCAKKIFNTSIKYGGTTIHSFSFANNKQGSYSKYLNVHLRENEKCKRCNSKIAKIIINGRSTYYCPNCQKIK